MKLIPFLILFTISLSSFAGDLETEVRCSGKTSNGTVIGVDFTLDSVNRVTSMTTFEEEAVSIIDLNSLVAPAAFLEIAGNGKIEIFTFQSYNEGLDFDNNVVFVNGEPNMSTLELGYRGQDVAISEISCSVLN